MPAPTPALRTEKRTPTKAPTPAPMSKKLKPTLAPRPKKSLSTPKDYRSTKVAGAFDDKYIEHKSEGDEELSIEECYQKIRHYLRDMINDLRASGD